MSVVLDIHRARALSKAVSEFDAALAALNRAGLALNALGIEPHVGGWTSPGNWGYIRCQGNLSVKYEELNRS
jgi:hypothetical protein